MASSRRQRPSDSGRVAQGQQLGVGRRVVGRLAFVVAAGDHPSVDDHDRADRHVAVLERGGRLLEGQAHRRVIVHRGGTLSALYLGGRGHPFALCDTLARRGPEPALTGRPTMSSIAGEFVVETFHYDGGRQVTAYIPPGPPEAVVFAGDGQLISQWGGVLEAADVPATIIVGAHRLADETLRLHEYSPGFDPERFSVHEEFFVDDVRRWAQSRFGVASAAGTHCGVRCLGEWGTGARHGPSAPGHLRCDPLRLAGCGLSTA